MRSLLIIVTAPPFDDDLSLTKRAEDLAVEQFVPQSGSYGRVVFCVVSNDAGRAPCTDGARKR
jgi:hypothetical protein